MGVELVSYIVATRNRKELCINTIKSILEQNWRDKEIILIDDYSDENMVEYIRKEFPEVKGIRSNKQAGVTGCRNIGIKKSTGDVLFFIDDDARFKSPDATEEVIKILESEEKMGIVNCLVIDAKKGLPGKREIPILGKKIPHYPCEIACFTGCAFAMKRELVEKVGIFASWIEVANEELEYSYRLLEAGYKIFYLTDVPVLHYSTTGNEIKWYEPYYTLRNRIIIAAKYLPPLMALSHILLWCGYSFIQAFKARKLADFLKALRDACSFLKKLPGGRTAISKDTVKRIKFLRGRTYY